MKRIRLSRDRLEERGQVLQLASRAVTPHQREVELDCPVVSSFRPSLIGPCGGNLTTSGVRSPSPERAPGSDGRHVNYVRINEAARQGWRPASFCFRSESRHPWAVADALPHNGSKAVRRGRVEQRRAPDPPLPEFVAPRQVTNRESQTAFRPQSGSRRGPLVVGSSGAAGAAPGGGVEDSGGSGSGGGAGSL